MAWWGKGIEKILGGRDGLCGGTWLGCTRDGRLAFLTNVLEPDALPCARTRGDLPLRFLQVSHAPYSCRMRNDLISIIRMNRFVRVLEQKLDHCRGG